MPRKIEYNIYKLIAFIFQGYIKLIDKSFIHVRK